MPDLVYRMRIELPDSETQSIKQQLQELESMKARASSGTGATGNVQQQTVGVKSLTDAIRRQTSELNRSRSAFRELQRVKGLEAEATKRAKEALEEKIATVRQEVSTLSQNARALNTSEREQVQLNNAVTASRNAFITADKSLQNYNVNLSMMGNQAGRNNKTFAGANQALFSFSDLIQDSTQFSQGFAQGMRAIGNNVGFTAELLIMMNRNAKAVNMTLGQALMASLNSAAGALIGLNIVMALGTALMTKMSKRTREADKDFDNLKDTVNELSGAVLNLSNVNDLNSSELLKASFNVGVLSRRFNEYARILKESDQDELAKLYGEQGQALAKQADETARRRQELIRIIQLETGIAESQIKTNLANIANNDLRTEGIRLRAEALDLMSELTSSEEQSVEEQIRALNLREDALSLDRRTLELQFQSGLLSREQFAIKDQEVTNDRLQLQIERQKLEALQEQLRIMSLADNRAGAPLIPVEFQFPSILSEEINIDPIPIEVAPPPAGSIARALEELQMLQDGFNQAQTESARKALASQIQDKKAQVEAMRGIEKSQSESTRQNAINLAASLSFIARGLFGDSKLAAIANAVINTYQAATQALASAPPPFNGVLMAGVIASGLAQVRKIQQTEIGSTPTGGGTTASSISQQTATGALSNRSVSEIEPRFIPRNKQDTDRPAFIIENRITDKQFATLVKSGNNKILSQAKAI